MKIAVGIPAFNEELFVEQSVQNCLDVGYDYVVYLDDGSTDATYEKLIYFTKDYDHMIVLKNENNSVLYNETNRWKIVARACEVISPDWIMVRAMDECLSYAAFKEGKNLLRKNLAILEEKGFNTIMFHYVDLWRSIYWYRSDGYWSNRHGVSAWKNNTGWRFDLRSGMHLGVHRPNYMDVPERSHSINLNNSKDLVVLHYGMSSNELLSRKLEYQIKTSLAVKERANGLPSVVPHPRLWNRYNGYKVAYEKNINLTIVEQQWFRDSLVPEPKPEIKSLYDVIVKYDKNMAEEYAKIYGR